MSKTEVSGKQVKDGSIELVDLSANLASIIDGKADVGNLAAVATSGSYNDLTNKPSLFSGAYADLTGKPSLSVVATSGSYNDLTNKPSIPSTLASLTGDVSISNPSTDQVLKYNGTSWVNAAAPSGSGGSGSGLSIEIYQDAEFNWSGDSSTRTITHNKGRQPDMVQVFVKETYPGYKSSWVAHFDLAAVQGGSTNYGWDLAQGVGTTNDNQTIVRLLRSNVTTPAPTRIRLYWFGTQGVGGVSSSGGWVS